MHYLCGCTCVVYAQKWECESVQTQVHVQGALTSPPQEVSFDDANEIHNNLRRRPLCLALIRWDKSPLFFSMCSRENHETTNCDFGRIIKEGGKIYTYSHSVRHPTHV